ncbi:ParB/Srx family N-terminal domain-containing protein [Ruminococcus sp.]|uniref:ParB/Srx family N-terminal domain-containing protein n=1 Tax=Ruminococcus sp. TaxID=41978 RepID=UPI003870AD65
MTDNPNLKIEQLPVEKLQQYENNARDHGQVDIDAIKKSITMFGFNDPIGIWSDDNVIVEGHGRLLAAKDLGMTEVPCIRLDHMTDEERRAYAIAHNRTAEMSSWNVPKLDLELAGIKSIDMAALGFKPVKQDIEVEDDEYEDGPETATTCRRGDIWTLGDHRLMCGDSTSENDVRALMGGGLVQMYASALLRTTWQHRARGSPRRARRCTREKRTRNTRTI